MSKRSILVVLLLAAAVPAFGTTSAWAVGAHPVTPSYTQIRFEKLGAMAEDGNVQVTPVNTINTFCSVTSFSVLFTTN